MTKVTMPITGMHCAACQARVQTALQKTPGVSDASVNLLLNTATVTYDEKAVQPTALVAAVKSTGYEATIPVEDPHAGHGSHAGHDHSQHDHQHSENVAELTRDTGISLAIAAVSMAISMLVMHASWTPWVLFVLSTIVVA